MQVLFLLVIILIAVGSFLYPRWRDQRIMKAEFPSEWEEIITRRLPFLDKLEKQLVVELRNDIKLFVAKKSFYGCDGLEMTDEIRVTIAASACLLLLNRQTEVYPKLRYILVYPAAFKKTAQQNNQDGTVRQAHTGLLGESWSNGKVILSWSDVESGVENFDDGQNVVLHEFAHQLDSHSGSTNGAPRLRKNSYSVWSDVFSKEFESLIKSRDKNYKATMDYYGATNPAEFFAVATETFFEKPEQMNRKHPELFEQLKVYYSVDPSGW